MISDAIPFIGRLEELTKVDRLLEQSDRVAVLCLEGDGGIGKTRLMYEIFQRFRSVPQVAITAPLDFDTPHLQVADNLYVEIAGRFDESYFDDYLRQLQDWHKMRVAGVSYDRLSQEEHVLMGTFKQCYQRLAGRRVVLLMDTLEKVWNTDVWSAVVKLIQLAANTLVVLSYRPKVDKQDGGALTLGIYEFLQKRLGEGAVMRIDLQPFSEQETTAYVQAKQMQSRGNLSPELQSRLVQIAEGKPILIDLAVEWLAREIPLPWLIHKSDAGLIALAPDEREEVEAALVRPVANLDISVNEIVMDMAYVYPLDEELISFLIDSSPKSPSELCEEISQLAFVKSLPNGKYSLHDEMRRMLTKYVWGNKDSKFEGLDPEFSRRRQISRKLVPYFERKAVALNKGLSSESSDHSPDIAKSFLARNIRQQDYGFVLQQQLFHQLRVDLSKGFELFVDLFEESTQAYQFSMRERFLHCIQEALDPKKEMEFNGRLDPDQQYGVKIRQVRYWLDTGSQSNISEAQQRLKTMLTEYRDGGPREVDMLSRMANCAIKSGNVPLAVQYLEQARAIVQIGAPQWLTKIANTLGWAYRLMERLGAAQTAYLAALSIAVEKEDIASICNNLGYVEALRGECEAGLRYCEQGRDLRERLGMQRELGMSYITIGHVYRYWGYYQKAVEYFDKALAIFEPAGDREWLAKAYSGRGAVRRIVATTNDEYKGAADDLHKAINQQVVTELAYATHVLGCVYWNTGDLDQALRLFKESEQQAVVVIDAKNQVVLDMRSHINNLAGFAEIYFLRWEQNHRPEYREKILQNAMLLEEEHKKGYELFHHQGRMKRVLGDLAYAEGRFSEALSLYAEAFSWLGNRFAGYGKRTFKEELSELEKHIDDLPPLEAVAWCNYLEETWSDPEKDIQRREDLITMCRLQHIKSRLRLSPTQN